MKLLSNPKKLFLIDGIGAIVSAIFLGVVLPQLHEQVGMPKDILYGLAIAPCFFMVYSFGCYFFLKSNRANYLKFIAVCNLVYCCITACLLYFYFDSLTRLGVFYFVVEIIIIVILVRAEWRSSSQLN